MLKDRNISFHQNKIHLDLSIIIVNYNLANEIENCLNSVAANFKEINYEIIIVDNNSTDKKLSEIEKKFQREDIKFYYLEENIGFGKGCNYGFSKSSAKYICFLNPDTLITKPIMQPIIKLFEEDQSVGVIGPRQMLRKNFFDFSAGYYPNLFFEIFNLIWVGTYFEAFLVFLKTKLTSKTYFRLDWILGAALFIKADTFKRINGFDKDYFMFFEEVDLCKRVSELGYKIIYMPSISINHIGSVSGKKDYSLFTKRTYTSKFLYVSKHCKFIYKFFMNFLISLQLFTQLLLWIIWFPFNMEKSKHKIEAFSYLIMHRLNIN